MGAHKCAEIFSLEKLGGLEEDLFRRRSDVGFIGLQYGAVGS